MQRRKNGIIIETRYSRTVDPKYREKRDGPKIVKPKINVGIYSTLVKYENGLAIWTMVLHKSKEYRESIAEGFKEVEKWERKKEAFN